MKKVLFFLTIMVALTSLCNSTLYATEYYVDATLGNDSNSGNSETSPWRTIAKINSSTFNPGDSIKFKCGEVWREQLNINYSGSSDNPIIFTKYGSGDNPRILQTEIFDAWELIDSGNHIYRGKIVGQERYYGMLTAAGDERTEGYLSKVPFSEWKNNYFHGYYGSGGYFLFRNNAGNPGQREIGVRPHGISVIGKEHIIIDSIDVYGPSGSPNADESSIRIPIRILSTKNIIIRNSSIKYSNGAGIKAEKFSYLLIENCHFQESWGGFRSIWKPYTSDNVTVSKCTFKNMATKNQDVGDRAVIGFARVAHILIEDCVLDYQGYLGNDGVIDYAIQFAELCSYAVIRRCNIKGAAQGCISVGNPEESRWEIYENVFDNWGNRPTLTYPEKTLCAIDIGAGMGSLKPGDVYIYKNLFINGPSTPGKSGRDSAIFLNCRDYKIVSIADNVFYDNSSIYDVSYWANTSKREIKNNIFVRNTGNAFDYFGTVYDFSQIVSDSSGSLQYDKAFVFGNRQENPLLNKDVKVFLNAELTKVFDNNIIVSPESIIKPGAPTGLAIQMVN